MSSSPIRLLGWNYLLFNVKSESDVISCFVWLNREAVLIWLLDRLGHVETRWSPGPPWFDGGDYAGKTGSCEATERPKRRKRQDRNEYEREEDVLVTGEGEVRDRQLAFGVIWVIESWKQMLLTLLQLPKNTYKSQIINGQFSTLIPSF